MRQKALLQARLGAYASESEEEPKKVLEKKEAKRKLESDVITLDDSSGEVVFKKDKKMRSKSPSRDKKPKERRDRERESSKPAKEKDERKSQVQDDGKRKREYDNRQKEDLRQEINRGKDRERDRGANDRRPER